MQYKYTYERMRDEFAFRYILTKQLPSINVFVHTNEGNTTLNRIN